MTPPTPTPRAMTLLPPPPTHCQECATVHLPEQPHNKLSLFYQAKSNRNMAAPRPGRMQWPTARRRRRDGCGPCCNVVTCSKRRQPHDHTQP